MTRDDREQELPDSIPDLRSEVDRGLMDRAYGVRRASGRVQARDFVHVSLIMNGTGWTLLLIGLITSRFATYVGVGMIATAVMFLAVGRGISKYRSWAWYAGLVLLVVITIASTIGALLFLFAVASPRGAWLMILPACCIYLIRAMVSKDGRGRYGRAAEARAKARENPDSLAARALRG